MNTLNMRENLREYGMLTVVTIVLILTDYLILFPNHFTFGGVIGVAVLLSGAFGGSPNTYAFILNAILFLIGFKVLGKEFGIRSVYVSILFATGLGVVQYLIPVHKPISNQPVLELVLAVLLAAACSGAIFNLSASTGGTDIIALMLKKYTSIHIGKALMVTDFFVVVLSFVIYGTTVGMFSLVGYIVKALFIDTVIESLNLCKYFTIISTEPQPICRFIQEELNHSATLCKAEGAYSHKEKTVILTVVGRRQAVKLRNFVRKQDSHAFMMITNSSEIIGKGFRDML